MKKEKRPDILTFAILTAITIATWVVLDVYRAFTKPTPLPIPEEVLEPFSATIDEGAMLEIENRVWVSDEEARTLLPQVLQPVPSPSPKPVATSEGEIQP